MQVRHGESGIEVGRGLVVVEGARTVSGVFAAQRQQVVGARAQLVGGKDLAANLFCFAKTPAVRQEGGLQQLRVRVAFRAGRQREQQIHRLGEALLPQELDNGSQIRGRPAGGGRRSVGSRARRHATRRPREPHDPLGSPLNRADPRRVVQVERRREPTRGSGFGPSTADMLSGRFTSRSATSRRW